MTNEEASVKMAEMAKVDVGLSTYTVNGKREVIMRNGKLWNPQKNIAQMLEVLRSLRSKGICYCMSNESSSVGVALFEGDLIDEDTFICQRSAGIDEESEAGFQAVKAYLEEVEW
jgi:hypothetical protein